MQEDSLTYHCLNDTIEKKELYFEKYFFKKYAASTSPFKNDSTITTVILSQPNLKQEEISSRPETFDWVFGIFLICFVFFSSIIGKRLQTLPAAIREFFAVKKRESIFSDTTDEWYGKLALCLQTCLLLALFLCRYFSYNSNIILDSPVKMIAVTLLFAFILCIFFILKWVIYYIAGLVFFDKFSLQTWTGNFFSIIAFAGIFLFVPVLLYFYTNIRYNFFFFFILTSLILFEILIIYKLIVLFFYKQKLSLHLFLYLCGQEIIPLFFLWRIMVYVFNNFVENSALWL